MNLIQFHLPDRVVLRWGEGRHPEFLLGSPGAAHLSQGGEVVGSNPHVEVVLWRVGPD